MTDVHVLSGFLGAGKTSLLRYMLEAGPCPGTVVLVNEFGQLGLDGRLLERDGLPLYELNSGCICCTLHDELGKTLRQILEHYAPERLIIEASGVANPVNIAATLRQFPETLHHAKDVALLDSRLWNRRAALGSLFQEQLAEADLLVLTKTDLLPEGRAEALRAAVSKAFPQADVRVADHGRLDPQIFWQPVPRRLARGLLRPYPTGATPEFHHLTFITDAPLCAERFDALLGNLPAGLLRAKGQVAFAEQTRYLDVVDGHVDWSVPPGGLQGTCLVFIGSELDEPSLRASLTACEEAGSRRSGG